MGRQKGIRVVVVFANQCKATFKDMSYLTVHHEKADTQLLLHAVDATASGATSIDIISPDTDVFVLALRRYPDLCEDTTFVTGKGQRYRRIPLGPIVRSLDFMPGVELTLLEVLLERKTSMLESVCKCR